MRTRSGIDASPHGRFIAGALACALALTAGGCGSFTAGVEEPDMRAQVREVRARIVVGETQRVQVRGMLGQPRYANAELGIELYASECSDASTEWLVVGIVPVPGWTQVRHYRVHPLVLYDAAGTVRGVEAGYYAEHHAQDSQFKQPDSRSVELEGFTLAVDPCPEASCLWLIAPVESSRTALRQTAQPGECVVDLARPPPGTRVELDGNVLLENLGAGPDAAPDAPALPWYARVNVSAGTHGWRATPTANAMIATGEVTRSLECRAGETTVVRFRRILGPSDDVLGRIQLRGEFETAGVETLPADARAVLFAGGRAIGVAGPGATPK